ncbi:putative N-acetylglucosamine-1-phosphate uridyltransferase [Pararobbsia alpina]|uniref:polymer-forming cytoskeletal protein n=1 Tax=Pararobbsia alpina TaxID=621374 RepID=UPI0039A669B6
MASLILLCAVLLVLGIPFVPLAFEWRKPSDVAALPIPEAAFEDARALAVRWITLLREAVHLRALDSHAHDADQSTLHIEERIALERGRSEARVLYATQSISIGREAQATYVFAERSIRFRAGSRLANFAYAPRVDACDADLAGTVSAHTLRLRGECRFTRLGGQPITLGIGTGSTGTGSSVAGALDAEARRSVDDTHRTHRPMTDFVHDRRHRFGDTRFRVRGDLEMPGHTECEADLVVDGAFYLGEASVLRGNVRAHTVELARHAVIQGAVFAHRDIVLREMSGIEGVLSAGRALHVRRASIGRRGQAVTASAQEIVVQEGASVHGELVAEKSGRFSESCQ